MFKDKIIILITVFIDVLGIGIVIPNLPTYTESFGVSTFAVTLLFSVFSLFSFFSSPILGTLSDKYGRKPIILYSLLLSAIGWFVFALCGNITLLFIGRIITGLGAGNFSAIQSAMTDLSKDHKDRTHNLGIIGATFGLGFMIGPALGGLLGSIQSNLPFLIVAILSFLNFCFAFFVFKETNKHTDHERKIVLNPFRVFYRIGKEKTVRVLYFVYFVFGVMVSASPAIFAIYVFDRYGFDQRVVGYFLTGAGLIIILNQTILLKKFWLKYFNEANLMIYMLVLFAIGSILQSAQSTLIFTSGYILFAFGQSILRTVMNSEIIGMADSRRRGEVSGVLASLMSLSAIVGPIFAGLFYEWNILYPLYISFILSIICAFILYFNRHDIKNISDISKIEKENTSF